MLSNTIINAITMHGNELEAKTLVDAKAKLIRQVSGPRKPGYLRTLLSTADWYGGCHRPSRFGFWFA